MQYGKSMTVRWIQRNILKQIEKTLHLFKVKGVFMKRSMMMKRLIRDVKNIELFRAISCAVVGKYYGYKGKGCRNQSESKIYDSTV